jgi:hypothetical protein
MFDSQRLRQLSIFLPWTVGIATSGAILAMTTRLWFFSEDLYFALDRPFQLNSIFYPNSEHLSAGPVLLYRVFYRLFGLNYFWIWMIPAAVSHSVLIAIMAKGSTETWKARHLGITAIFGLFGPGYLNFIWPFQYAFITGICLGCVVLRRVTRRFSNHLPNSAASWAADSALLLLGVAHASTALMMVPAYFVVAAASRNRTFFRQAMLTLAAVAVPYSIWYWHYRSEISAVGRRLSMTEFAITTGSSVAESLSRAGVALTGVPWNSAPGPVLGLTVAGLLSALTLWRHPATSLAVALLITLFISTITINFTRRALLGRTPDTEHYVYLWSALLLGIACCVLPEVYQTLKQRLSRARVWVLMMAFCLLAGGANAVSLRRTIVGRERYLTDAMCAYGIGRSDPSGVLLAETLSYPPIASGRFSQLLVNGKLRDDRLLGKPTDCGIQEK